MGTQGLVHASAPRDRWPSLAADRPRQRSEVKERREMAQRTASKARGGALCLGLWEAV